MARTYGVSMHWIGDASGGPQRRRLPFAGCRALALGLGVAILAGSVAGAEEPAVDEPAEVAQAPDEDPAEVAQAPEPAPPASGSQAPRESGIEEIVVRGAESEASKDFEAGDSVTGFGAEDLAALGAQSIADLAAFTPNLEIVTAGATTPTFFIRGVGLNDFNPNSTGAVAVFRDDVAINAPAIQLGALFDVEAVNILRGPQGTGLNRNASAGAIKIYARKPTGQFGGYLRSEFGTYDYRNFEGAVEAPIREDILATRAAFRFSQRDGTMSNGCADALPLDERPIAFSPNPLGPWSMCGERVNPGQISHVPPGLAADVNNINNWAARGMLLFQPTLDMTWLLNAHGSERNELSRLGQSIGTSGNYCPEGAGVPCSPIVEGLLGGSQAALNTNTQPSNAYMPQEIRDRYRELGGNCFLIGNCNTPGRQQAANRAKLQVMKELVSLDSRPWHGDFDLTGPTTNDTWGISLNGSWTLPGIGELRSTSGYDTYDRLIGIDLDFSPQTLFHITTDDDGWQYYQALSFSGQLADTPVEWSVGGWFLREVLNVLLTNNFGGNTVVSAAGVKNRDYTQTLWSAAGYASFSFDFWRNFTLDGGVRWNWEQKDMDMLIVPFTQGGLSPPAGCTQDVTGNPRCLLDDSWSAPTGTIRLTYRFREDTQAYWKYTRGWKPGTYNATASQFTGPTAAEPEELDAFEGGLRGSWFDGRLGLDASLFYYSYSQYQIFTARQLFGSPPQFLILNANDAEVYGSEIDAVARPWFGAFVNVRFSWLESQFLDFLLVDQFLTSGSGQGAPFRFKDRQASGNPLLNSPRFKVSLTGEQTLPLGRYGSLSLRYDGVWTDTTYYDSTAGRGQGNEDGVQFLPPDTIAQQPFWLHNLRLGWRAPNGRMELAGWVRNLTNEAYKTFAFDGSNFQATTIYFVGDPRTIGGSVVFNF